MNCESIYVLKSNNSVENYRKIEEIINRIYGEIDVWGLAKAVKDTECNYDYDDAWETNNSDFTLNKDELFVWVKGKYHRINKSEMLKVCRGEEEIGLVDSLEIGFPIKFPKDFYEDLEKWMD